jgi:hypothetical protein
MSRARTPVDGLRQKLRVELKRLGLKDFKTDLRRDGYGNFLFVTTSSVIDPTNRISSFLDYRVIWQVSQS